MPRTVRQQRVAIAILAALAILGSGLQFVRPSEHNPHRLDRQNAVLLRMAEARGQEIPAPTLPADKPEHTVVGPALRFDPENAPPGTPVTLTFTPPLSDRVVLKWGPQKFGKKTEGANNWDVWPLPGENVATATVLWTTADSIESVTLTATHVCGEPPPPKPLAEIAGADAKKLGGVYQLLAGADDYVDLADFHGTEALELADKQLTANPAVPVIAERLSKIKPFDVAKLVAELKAIAGELGAEPTTPTTPVDPTVTVTAATYVYEKDDTAVPVGVSTALNRLNRERNIRATLFEEDTVDGDGDVPDQYAVALRAATDAGLPAFVVQAGDKVLVVLKSPMTEAQLLEAVP